MDTISIIISLFIPISICIGYGFFYIIQKRVLWRLFVRASLIIACGIIMIFGITQIPKYTLTDNAYVTKSDLVAMNWIKSNTPQDSLFLVNTVNFDFNPDFIISIDAGYWLPLLGNRQTITIPMIFPIERLAEEDILVKLQNIHTLNSDFTSPQSLEIIKNYGIKICIYWRKIQYQQQ